MNIFVQLASDLGADVGPNFSVTANVGTVTPNTSTRTELLNGRFFDVDQNATNLTISSLGSCNTEIQTQITGDTPDTCFASRAEDWSPGMPRRVDEDGSPLPFREQQLDPSLCEQISSIEFGQPPITVTIFNNTYIFLINEENADESTGILYRSGITSTGIEPESTLVIEIQDFGFGEVSIMIFDYKKNTVYEIISGSGSCLAEEWSIYDYMQLASSTVS